MLMLATVGPWVTAVASAPATNTLRHQLRNQAAGAHPGQTGQDSYIFPAETTEPNLGLRESERIKFAARRTGLSCPHPAGLRMWAALWIAKALWECPEGLVGEKPKCRGPRGGEGAPKGACARARVCVSELGAKGPKATSAAQWARLVACAIKERPLASGRALATQS